jgi:hypothetical protein
VLSDSSVPPRNCALLLLSCLQEKMTIVAVWHDAGFNKQPAGWRMYAQIHRMSSAGLNNVNRLVGAVQIWPLPASQSSSGNSSASPSLADVLTIPPGQEAYNNPDYEALPPGDSTIGKARRPKNKQFNVPEFSLDELARYKGLARPTMKFRHSNGFGCVAHSDKGKDLLEGVKQDGDD